jgi:molybdopterin synthase catalytic subunit
MANSACKVLITEDPLKNRATVGESYSSVHLESGAVVHFWGVVRRLEGAREIDGIDYEANRTMAEHQMMLIAGAATEKFKLDDVQLYHRIGFVPAGEASLFLRVSAKHRGAAFDASKWIVDELKKKVPIWKRMRFTDANQTAPSALATR